MHLYRRCPDREYQLRGRLWNEGTHGALWLIGCRGLCPSVTLYLAVGAKIKPVLVIWKIQGTPPTKLVFRSSLEILLIFLNHNINFRFWVKKNGFLPETRQLPVSQRVEQ